MIGVFGGTFDPVHKGHIAVAELLLKKTTLTEIRFIPCYQPVHRGKPGASAQQRLQMLQLAIANNKQFTVDDCEIKRQGPSYMIDTLLDLKQRLQQPLALIMGYDAWQGFQKNWRQWQQILTEVKIIILNRPSHQLALKNLIEQYQHQIQIIEDSHFDISATAVREAISTADAAKSMELLPEAVYSYILEHGLYQQN